METAFRARDHKSGIDSMAASADVQRPPVYNAEDYTGYLRKYCKLTGVQLYVNTGTESSVKTNKTKLRAKTTFGIENDDIGGKMI